MDAHSWTARLRDLLDAGGPAIAYQPIVNLWTEVVVGFEALSRFPDGQGPAEWFAAAEDVGLGDELELAAARNAIRGFLDTQLHGYLSVNASPGLMARHCIAELFPPGMPIQLEITETSTVPAEVYPLVVRRIEEARRNGAKIAVDDVGIGYAMGHVTALYPDTIKLDREFVGGLHDVHEVARRAVARAYCALAEQLHVEIVAEGIERREEVTALRTLGVTRGQGFYYARPCPAAELHGVVALP